MLSLNIYLQFDEATSITNPLAFGTMPPAEDLKKREFKRGDARHYMDRVHSTGG